MDELNDGTTLEGGLIAASAPPPETDDGDVAVIATDRQSEADAERARLTAEERANLELQIEAFGDIDAPVNEARANVEKVYAEAAAVEKAWRQKRGDAQGLLAKAVTARGEAMEELRLIKNRLAKLPKA